MIAIAFSTFKEIYRKKIFHVVGVLTIAYLGILTFILNSIGKEVMSHKSMITMIADLSSVISILGFYFSSMLVAFLTIMLSIGIISSEVESGTILTILTKPIRRSEYILGKYIGTGILIILYSAFIYIAVIAISAISGISIVKTFGIISLGKGFLFFILQPLTILALSIYGGTRFKTLNNGILVIFIYMVGLIGGVMEQIGAMVNKSSLTTIGIIASLISPFEAVYKKMISSIFSTLGSFSVFGGFGTQGTSTTPSIWMMIYVFGYLIFFIFISIRTFNKKDIV